MLVDNYGAVFGCVSTKVYDFFLFCFVFMRKGEKLIKRRKYNQMIKEFYQCEYQ